MALAISLLGALGCALLWIPAGITSATTSPVELHALSGSTPAARAATGSWRPANEALSARAAAYEARVGGRAGSGYEVGGVKFDAHVNGALVEAKGPGYASFVSGGRFQPWFRGADKMASQAQRQLAAAGGVPIRWAVAEPQAATAIQGLFRSRGISGIDVVHIPPG